MKTQVAASAFWLLALGVAAQDQPASKADYTLFNPTPPALLRPFSTDRPSKVNSPTTIDAGHLQYETDLAIYSYSHSAGAQTLSVVAPDPTFKLGLTNTIEADLQITPYMYSQTTVDARTTRVSGVGDTYLRLKYSLFGDDGGALAAAFFPYVKLPTARGALGNGRVEVGTSLPLGITAPLGFTFVVMPEVDLLKNVTDGGMHPTFDFIFEVGHAITAKLQETTEIYLSHGYEHGQPTAYTVDEDFTYALTPTLQLDFAANIGLNTVQPQLQLFGGVSQRF